VLSDKQAIDAMLVVAKYLHSHTRKTKIFSLRACDVTFEMAVQFGMNDDRLLKILRNEENEAQRRKIENWIKVTNKQKRAADLRNELSNLKTQLDKLNEDYKNRYNSYKEKNALGRRIVDCEESIRIKSNEVTQAEAPINVLYQPYPEDRSKTMKILFFLHMPLDIKEFSRLSFTAQQMLLPRDFDFHKKISSKGIILTLLFFLNCVNLKIEKF
jgi:hypothetical protein